MRPPDTGPRPVPGRRQRRLGQNFMADTNLLDAIVADAGLSGQEVVLEVGGGAGALTERLAPVSRLVHVVEFDERLRPTLDALADGLGNVEVTWGDALRVDLGALDPAPDRLVANLPYSVATPLLLETIAGLPSISEWLVMCQAEVAERIRAETGTRPYGAPSVMVQASCAAERVRAVDPAVFTPRPRVRSELLRLRRHPGATLTPELRDLVRDAFAHRRKPLARSVEIRRPGSLETVREGLVELGIDPGVRAQQVTPAQFVALAERVASILPGGAPE